MLIEDGQVRFESYSADPLAVNADTLFSLASMSKWFAAYGAMLLVEQGKVALDTPVTEILTRWQLPPSEFDNSGVTLRALLSHTAGLDDGLGFGDYTADETSWLLQNYNQKISLHSKDEYKTDATGQKAPMHSLHQLNPNA